MTIETAVIGRTGRPLWVLGHKVTVFETDGDYAMLEVVTMPGVDGPPPHHHPDFGEFFYVAAGRLEVMTDGAWRMLEAGGACTVPAGVVHGFRNPDAVPATFVTGFSPRGFERFFLDLGIPADRPDAQAASVAPEAFGRVAERAAGYGMIIAA